LKTLDGIARDLIAKREAQGASARTVQELGYYLRAFLDWLRDVHQVSTADGLRAAHLEAYQGRLAGRTNSQGLPFRPGYLNNHIWAVRMIAVHLWENGYTPANLGKHIRSVKEPKLLPTSVLSHKQVRRLLRSVELNTTTGYRDRTILELLYSTGIRCGELQRLTVDDIDLENAQLKVLGKGRKERMTPIGATARRFLETYLKAIRPLCRGAGASRAVFLNQRGRPLGRQSVQNMVRRRAEKLRLSVRVTPHTFRRSCTTEMIRANANLYHVKELLGHESLDTLRPYTKLTIVDLKKTHAKCHPRERDEQRERG